MPLQAEFAGASTYRWGRDGMLLILNAAATLAAVMVAIATEIVGAGISGSIPPNNNSASAFVSGVSVCCEFIFCALVSVVH